MISAMGGITTHSTRADLARMSSARLDTSLNVSRRVNSGVMRLLGLNVKFIYTEIGIGSFIER
jgi:hypothetical protein